MPDTRILNLAGFLSCTGLMAYALYAQYQLLMEPCPLCVLQRVAVIALGLIFLIAAAHNTRGTGRFAYAALLVIASAAGAIVAGRHVWLQHLPADEIPACGPGLDYMLENFPFRKALDMIFTGSGECANVDWQFLGMSMPAWVLIAVLALGAAGTWNNLRRT